MVTRLAPTAKPAASIATRPAAPASGSATPASAKPASKPASKHAGKPMGERVANALLSTRVVSSPKPAPVDSFWYKCKKALATVFCNLTTPKLETRTLATSSVPAGLEATLKPGDVSEVLKTPRGYGIVTVKAWYEPGVVPLDKVKEKLERALVMAKQRDFISNLVKGAREKIPVEMYKAQPGETGAAAPAPAPAAPPATPVAPDLSNSQ